MFGGIGFVEIVVIGIVAVLLFGQRLPEVARNFGRSYRELRKSLNEIKSTIDFDIDEPTSSSSYNSNSSSSSFDPVEDIDEPTAPKLAPPPSSED